MNYRTLGHGLKVSAIGIGCMPMIRGGNIAYGLANLDESIAAIHEAIDLGVTFFDTAEMYGPFSNEELLGQAIKDKREKLIIATKFAMKWNGNEMAGLDGSPANAPRLRRFAEASRHRNDRPLLSAPCGSGRTDRRDGRWDGRTGQRRESSAHRVVRSGR